MDMNTIYVKALNNNRAMLCFKNIKCDAYIGKNGITTNKIEGDKKTLLGGFELGIAFGVNQLEKIKIDNSIEYKRIEDTMFWVSDGESKYYNQLVNVVDNACDWEEAEHLIEYPIEYELAVEIKINPKNIPYKGSAIFLHCSNNMPTSRMYCNR